MRKEDIYRFLIRTAIPEVAAPWETPDDEDLAKYFHFVETPNGHGAALKSNLVWDAVYKANQNVRQICDWKSWTLYSYIDRRGQEIEQLDSPRIEGVARELFASIMESNSPLSSKSLIFELYETFPEPKFPFHNVQESDATRFGVIQLLVNLTLKYLLILKTFGCVEVENIEIDETGCDCPLDPATCEAMGRNPDGWKRITPKEYSEIQCALRKAFFLDSGIAYDFRVRFPEMLFTDN